MPVYVHYKVPLIAEVDPDTAEVVSVHLDDEAIEGPLGTFAEGHRLSPRESDQALRIAESVD